MTIFTEVIFLYKTWHGWARGQNKSINNQNENKPLQRAQIKYLPPQFVIKIQNKHTKMDQQVLKKVSKQNGFYKHSMQSNTSLALWLEHYSMLLKHMAKSGSKPEHGIFEHNFLFFRQGFKL
jgi:hypothetical protein